MVKLVFWSHWHPNSNGTDYWDVLGIYPDDFETNPETRREAEAEAYSAASDRFSWPSEEEQDEDGIVCEGPDVCVEVYDPEKHDMLRSGGGSFEAEFAQMS